MTEITDTPSNRSVGQRAGSGDGRDGAHPGARSRHPALRLAVPLLLMAVIFYFSAQPYDGPDLAWWEVLARKLGHFGGYAALASAWWWALRGLVGRPLAWAAAISLAYACSDEYHQTFVEGRSGQALDVGIDSLGIAFAAVAIRRRGALRPTAASRSPARARS